MRPSPGPGSTTGRRPRMSLTLAAASAAPRGILHVNTAARVSASRSAPFKLVAHALSQVQGFGDRLEFQVADALQMPFADNSFDLVWSMESGEHMPDKRQFVSELARVCKPGGRVIVVAWCHRDLQPGEASLLPFEERLLDRINRAYYLPRWCSGADYERLAGEFGMEEIQTDDWTRSVRRFWPAVILSALRPRNLWRLLRAGMATLRGALVMPLMIRGQKLGTIKFALMTATKAAPPVP